MSGNISRDNDDSATTADDRHRQTLWRQIGDRSRAARPNAWLVAPVARPAIDAPSSPAIDAQWSIGEMAEGHTQQDLPKIIPKMLERREQGRRIRDCLGRENGRPRAVHATDQRGDLTLLGFRACSIHVTAVGRSSPA